MTELTRLNISSLDILSLYLGRFSVEYESEEMQTRLSDYIDNVVLTMDDYERSKRKLSELLSYDHEVSRRVVGKFAVTPPEMEITIYQHTAVDGFGTHKSMCMYDSECEEII